MEFAQAWLAEGPPYYGDSEFKDKGEMYRCGGRFDKEKKLWKAIDKDSFVNMVQSGKWTPQGVDGPIAVRVIQLQFQKMQEEKSKKAYQEAVAKNKNKKPELTPEQVEEKARKEAGIPDDKPEELERLAKDGITQVMIRKTFNWGTLGPKSGKSDALRVLCGLKWNIITVEEVRTGVLKESFVDRNARRMREEREAKLRAEGKWIPAKKQKVHRLPEPAKKPVDPYSREGAKIFYEQQAAPEPEPQHQEMPRIYNQADFKWLPDTVCSVCKAPVTDQFMDCQCAIDGAAWARCGKCGEKYRVDERVGMWNRNKLCGCSGKKSGRAS